LLPSHDRFAYSPITERPDFTWPDGRRLAVYVAVCIEHFPYNEGGLGLSYSPGLEHPNTYNWAWREYGNRVGGFRLLEMFERLAIRPTALVNGACYEHCPQLLQAYRNAGTEFVAHGRTNGLHPNGLDVDTERAVIREVRDVMQRAEGVAPRGWMSPGANPSAATEDLLAEQGFTYTLDWPIDDQPTWMRTASGPLLSVPYPHEVNDVPAIVMHDTSAATFADMAVDTVDEMLEQSVDQPLVCGIVLHSFIVGHPFRLRRFRRALEHIAAQRDRIWFTTPGDVADFYAAEVEPAPALAGTGAIGQELARRLSNGVDGMALSAVSARDHDKARRVLAHLGVDVPVVTIEELEPLADIVVECAPAAVLPAIVEPVVRAGKEVVVLSAGMLLQRPDLIDLAREHGGQISVPTGALLGLDAVGAAAEAGIRSVRMTTRKPAEGLAGAPHLQTLDLDVEQIDGRLPREPQHRGRARPGRRRSGAHLRRGLDRPRGHAQHPHDRGRRRGRELHDDDRERAVGQPAYRQERGPLHNRRLARVGVGVEDRQLAFGAR
jgi:allantoinase